MKRHAYCFDCDGKFGAEDGIASARRSSFAALKRDPEVLRPDLRTIQKFYKLNKKSLSEPLCWDCSLFRVLGYIDRYDDKRNE